MIEPAAGGSGAAVPDLSLHLPTPAGRIHPHASYVDMRCAAGLTGVAAVEPPSGPAAVMITGRWGRPTAGRRSP